MVKSSLGIFAHPTHWSSSGKRWWRRQLAGKNRISRFVVKAPPQVFNKFLHRQLVRPNLSIRSRWRQEAMVQTLSRWHAGDIDHVTATSQVQNLLHSGARKSDTWSALLDLARVLMSVGLFRASLDCQKLAWTLLDIEATAKPDFFTRLNHVQSLIYRGQIDCARRALGELRNKRPYQPVAGAVNFLSWYLELCFSGEPEKSRSFIDEPIPSRWESEVKNRDVLVYGPGQVQKLPALNKGFLVSRIMGPGVFQWNSKDDLVNNKTDIVYSIKENIQRAQAAGDSEVLRALEKYDWLCVKKTDILRSRNSRAVNTFSPLFSRGHPQMVPLAVLDLLHAGSRPVVIGSDFFSYPVSYRPSDQRFALTGERDGAARLQSVEGSDGGSFDRTSLMASHQIIENWTVIKNMFQAGLLRGDARFSAVMTLNAEKLFDIYDVNLGAPRI